MDKAKDNHNVLKKKSAQGGLVTLVGQGLNTFINLFSTIILARLLSPEDYGIITMVLVVTGFAKIFRDLGLSTRQRVRANKGPISVRLIQDW